MEDNKQEIVSEVDKEKEMVDKYIRRQAVLKNKYPNILNAPKSIQDEYMALSSLVDSLKTSRREIWGKTVSSDGCAIDKFVSEKYEKALSDFCKSNKENEQYITIEEDSSFKFPEIDFEGLREEAQGMTTENDYRKLYSKLAKLKQEPLPEATKLKLYEIQKEVAQISMDGKLEKEQPIQTSEVPAPVNESKFAQIYEKAKGRIQEAFSKIKSIFKDKSKDKNNDNKDIEERE